MSSLEDDADEAGCRLLYSRKVQEVHACRSEYLVTAGGNEFRARVLVNSSGLYANDVSRMAAGPEYRVDFIRGEYYEILGGRDRWNIHRLIYPVAPPGAASKGIHLGPRLDGRLFIGPNAYRVEDRTDYDSVVTPMEVFLQAARRFIPQIRAEDIEWSYSGIRPRTYTSRGQADFVIRLERRSPALINLVGIDSPGLSSSMAIAKYVAAIAKDALVRQAAFSPPAD
jgi:glycerol-3-phosphate dehydrogenase